MTTHFIVGKNSMKEKKKTLFNDGNTYFNQCAKNPDQTLILIPQPSLC
jgi:hypothetical protein